MAKTADYTAEEFEKLLEESFSRKLCVADVVEGTVVKHDKDKKVLVYKQRAKKGYRRKNGHRQNFTRVMINKIRTTAKKSEAETTAEG